MNTLITITYPCFGDFIDSQAQGNLLIPDGPVAIGSTADLDYLTSPPFANPIVVNHLYHQGALVSRPQSFLESTSCNMCLSSERSATICLRRRFSSSSCFKRRNSPEPKPL